MYIKAIRPQACNLQLRATASYCSNLSKLVSNLLEYFFEVLNLD